VRKPVQVVLAAFVLVLALAAPATAKVKIVAPATVEGAQPVQFAAALSQPAEEVAFYVDGRRRYVDRSPSWQVGRSGQVNLGVGRHLLKVRATQGRAVTVTTRGLYVEPGTVDETTAPSIAPSRSRPVAIQSPSARPTAPSAVPPPSAEPSDPNLLFDGASISDFSNQSAPGAVREVADPVGSGESVFKMTVEDGDVYPLTPTENPRAQLASTEFIDAGEEFWWHARFYLPEDFPSYLPNWLTLLEGPYGRPWDGSPPVSIEVNGDNIRWQRNDTYDWDVPWNMPIPRGQWTDVVYHTKFGADGFVEMWINGQPVTFFADDFHNPNDEAPTTHLDMATMDHTNRGGHGAVIIQNYRKVNMFDSVSVYHGKTQVGTTRSSVE
jgi:hypothetical protein